MCFPCRRRVSRFSARNTRSLCDIVESSSPVAAAISLTQASPWLSIASVRNREGSPIARKIRDAASTAASVTGSESRRR